MLQSVEQNAHPSGYDIVQHHVYDSTGKEVYQYLPFANPLNIISGYFVPNPKTKLRAFYDQAGPDEEPYSKTIYDNSPINRTLKSLAPGKSWVGTGRGIVTHYRGNEDTEGVKIWTIGEASDAVPVNTGTYKAYNLYVTESTDEDGSTVIEYKDKNGKVILSKSRLNNGTNNPHLGYAATYFVYDDKGQLRYTIPPKAVQAIESSWNVASVPELCFSYYYDKKGRVVERKIPGKGVEYLIYDLRDRVCMTQDANQRAKNLVAFTFYDVLDRPLVSGMAEASVSREQLVSYVEDNTTYPNTDFLYYIKTYNLYHVYPPSNLAGCKFLSYYYYDDYDQLPSYAFDQSQFSNQLPATSTKPFVVEPKVCKSTKGKLTGSKVRVLNPESPDSEMWLNTVNYFDDQGQIIQTFSQNHLGGVDITSNIYSFQGDIWKSILRHQNPGSEPVPGANGPGIKDFKIVKTYERNYGLNGGTNRVWQINQQINDGPIFNLVNYDYDHLGRVTIKDFRAGIVRQDYNIRGMLSRIIAENHSVSPFAPIFEENISYDKGFKSKLYNGNIAGIVWSGSDAIKKAYGYSYDKVNRVTHAQYNQYDGSQWTNDPVDLTASNMSYDFNGNLLTMNQRGGDPSGASSSFNMDILSYDYYPNSNQLKTVEDAGSSDNSFPDFKNNVTGAEEYKYDQNGNLTNDENKKITSITYNDLNNIEEIVVGAQGKVIYTYDATGNKLRKKILNDGQAITYDYVGDVVYKDKVLQYISNEEGKARPIANTNTANLTKFVYDYFVKDHLGNVRSTITATPINPSYLAKHEISLANVEQLVFDNIPNVRDLKPGSTNPDDNMAAGLVAEDPAKRVGTAIMLRVLPGDKFTIGADSYYEGDFNPGESISGNEVVESVMGALMGGNTYDGVPLNELPDNIRTVKEIFTNPSLGGIIETLPVEDADPAAPKAYLNYLFFNEKMELISEISGRIQVPQGTGTTGFQSKTKGICNCTGIGPGFPGYVVIYVDNQSIGKKVWFDNIHLEHYTSNVLSEDHYYPYGLTLNTLNNPTTNVEQPIKYQGIELERNLNLETYETHYRALDPQIGRFRQVDPKAEATSSISPYASMDDNPVSKIDPLGDKARDDDTKLGVVDRTIFGVMSAIGMVGRQLSMPTHERAPKTSKEAVSRFNRDFVKGIDMIMLLSTPYLALESSPSSVAKSENTILASDLRIAEQSAGTIASGAKSSFQVVQYAEGTFSIWNWSGYPEGLPKPKGPFRLLYGEEYTAARAAANKANKALNSTLDLAKKEVDIHEVIPVKFGGSPTNVQNKVFLEASFHRKQVTPWWNRIQKSIEKKP
ncbi:RHS repeat-associated protein [Chitinophaga sp. OAE865]